MAIVERRQPLAIGQYVIVHAAHVDAVAVRMRTRHVERFHAAMFAEQMPRHAGVEAVLGQCVRAADQTEPRSGYDQVNVARHPADRAGAGLYERPRRRVDFEADLAAMAPARAHDQTRTRHAQTPGRTTPRL